MPRDAPLGVGGHRPDAKIKMAPRQKIPYFRGAAGGLSQVCRMVGMVGDLNYSLWLPLRRPCSEGRRRIKSPLGIKVFVGALYKKSSE